MLSSGGSGGIGALGLMYRIGTAFELANRWREQRLLPQHLLLRLHLCDLPVSQLDHHRA